MGAHYAADTHTHTQAGSKGGRPDGRSAPWLPPPYFQGKTPVATVKY